MKFLEVYTGCIVIWTLYYFIGKILFRREKNLNKWLLVAIILLFSLVLTMINISNLQIFEGVSKLFISYIMVCIYYNIVFKKLNNESGGLL